MNWRLRWVRLSPREQRLIIAAGAVLGLALVRFLIVSPFLAYREGLRDEIVEHREMLENAHRYLARAPEVTRQRDLLRARYRELRTQLVPGDTPTLAAASLQDTLHSVAVEKGVTIQSTQVMREDTVGAFRRISVRITATGELRQLAEFLTAVEYGPRRVTLPFMEISRRGAVLRGQSARALAATIEVAGFLQTAEDETPVAEVAGGPGASDAEEAATSAPDAAPQPAETPAAAEDAATARTLRGRARAQRPAVGPTGARARLSEERA